MKKKTVSIKKLLLEKAVISDLGNEKQSKIAGGSTPAGCWVSMFATVCGDSCVTCPLPGMC